MCVCDSADLFYQHIESQLEAFGLTEDAQGRPIKARDLVDIVDGYKGLGYGKSTEDELGEKVECHKCIVYSLILIPVWEWDHRDKEQIHDCETY